MQKKDWWCFIFSKRKILTSFPWASSSICRCPRRLWSWSLTWAPSVPSGESRRSRKGTCRSSEGNKIIHWHFFCRFSWNLWPVLTSSRTWPERNNKSHLSPISPSDRFLKRERERGRCDLLFDRIIWPCGLGIFRVICPRQRNVCFVCLWSQSSLSGLMHSFVLLADALLQSSFLSSWVMHISLDRGATIHVTLKIQISLSFVGPSALPDWALLLLYVS